MKPDNLFVTEDGRVKILDFGLAKVTRLSGDTASDSALATQEMDSPGTHPGTILGTVGYMAPEQVRGKGADARSDIFALGAILYEMLAGRRAFRGESSVETMSAILKEDPPALSQLGQEVAPDGEQIAFIHHPFPGDDGGLVAVTDLDGVAESLTEEWSSIHGLAWTPDGRELWFTAAREGVTRALHAVDLNGRSRTLYTAPASLILHDISSDGRVLMTRDVQRQEMVALAPDEPRERDVSWLDWSIPAGLSSDGKTLLFTEAGEGGGTDYTVYKRGTDGRTPAVRLGDGLGIGLSADGTVAVVIARNERGQLSLVPTGAGEARTISTDLVRALAAFPRPDADNMLVVGLVDGQGVGFFAQPYDGGPVHSVTPPGVVDPSSGHRQGASTVGGDWIVAPGEDAPWVFYPADGGEAVPVDELTQADIPLHVSSDRRFVYVVASFDPPTDIWRVDIETGERQFWRRVEPIDPAGVSRLGNILMVAEPDAYVTAYMRTLSDLYLVDGLR